MSDGPGGEVASRMESAGLRETEPRRVDAEPGGRPEAGVAGGDDAAAVAAGLLGSERREEPDWLEDVRRGGTVTELSA